MQNQRYAAHYPRLDQTERAYATMIESVDTALGDLLETLRDTGELENTIIVFHSDNGGLSAHARGMGPGNTGNHHHNAPLRSGKGSAYEGGTRVPLVIVWPGVTDQNERAGTIEHTPVVSHDLFPTFIALAGLQADHGPNIDGHDLSTLLTGRPAMFDSSRTLLWNQPHQWGAKGPGIEPFTSVRRGNHKLIYFHAGRRFELYDLGQDLGETTNLIASHAQLALRLAQNLDEEMQRQGGQTSISRMTQKPIESAQEALKRYLATLPQ
jgi:arylsulfatase A-like enzyme